MFCAALPGESRRQNQGVELNGTGRWSVPGSPLHAGALERFEIKAFIFSAGFNWIEFELT